MPPISKKEQEVAMLKNFLFRMQMAGEIETLDDDLHRHPDLLLHANDKKIGVEIVYPRNEERMNPKKFDRDATIGEVRTGTDTEHVLNKIDNKLTLYSSIDVNGRVNKHRLDELWLLVYGGVTIQCADDLILDANSRLERRVAELKSSFKDSSVFDKIFLSDTRVTWEFSSAFDYERKVIVNETH
jgi:hypothetical protein